MAEAEDRAGDGPAERPGSGRQDGPPAASTPAAGDAKRQDKTGDKPDSGQNEDG